jgi:electron transfer flavoprotein beta subunit
VINVGLAENEQIIRKALAIGADSAIRVDLDPTDAFQVAAEIAANATGFDLVISG